MATKQEIIEGLRFLAREARRAASHFDEEHWDRRTADGWTVKEVYCHILASAEGITAFLPLIQNLPDGTDLGAAFNIDIDEMNAQGVARHIDKAPAELVEGVARAYEGLVPLIEGLDQMLLDKPVKFESPRGLPVSEIAVRSFILHGLAHTYHCVAAQ